VEAGWVGVRARFWVVADVGNDFGVLVFQRNHDVVMEQALPCVVPNTERVDDIGADAKCLHRIMRAVDVFERERERFISWRKRGFVRLGSLVCILTRLLSFGYTGAISAHSSPHGTMRSISVRNFSRRVVLLYFSKPVPRVIWLLITVLACIRSYRSDRGLLQRFPKSIGLF